MSESLWARDVEAAFEGAWGQNTARRSSMAQVQLARIWRCPAAWASEVAHRASTEEEAEHALMWAPLIAAQLPCRAARNPCRKETLGDCVQALVGAGLLEQFRGVF